MLDSEPMSTTSHKSNTRIKSEAAMKNRVHTSRQDRDLTGDGLSKNHNEATAMRARTAAETVRVSALASDAKRNGCKAV
jgi:hypothetical protein